MRTSKGFETGPSLDEKMAVAAEEAGRGLSRRDRHRANILERLGMRNRVELTRYAIRNGLVDA
jgi:hypothetical protein